MSDLQPRLGLVIHYKFLFSHEAQAGIEEAREFHPCAIVGGRRNEHGNLEVRLMPISHTPPYGDVPAIELNHKVKAHLGLDTERQWLKTNEVNRFEWPGLESDVIEVPAGPKKGQSSYGTLPSQLLDVVRDQHRLHVARGRANEASRDFDPRAEMDRYRKEQQQERDDKDRLGRIQEFRESMKTRSRGEDGRER